ncbi:Clp protease/crotonase-like domain-containing protein [Dongshaea marina]|uniref:hypothetical protein n=1 Tax=Dongshaea marina TaxID=2047966 RepID=UPI000D3E074C|nr:hypothetical protein [Dongshaea marina]
MSNLYYTHEASLKNFKYLEVIVKPEQKSAWLYLNSEPRSCFTPELLKEVNEFHSILKNLNGKLPHEGRRIDIEFNIITSRHPVFSFGGIWHTSAIV